MKSQEKGVLKKASDIVGWLCLLVLAWMFFMAYHDDYEWKLRFLFDLFPDSALWSLFLYLLPLFLIWVLYRLLKMAVHVKFGKTNRSLKERDPAFGRTFFPPGKHPYVKFFLINMGMGAFCFYLIVISLDNMFEGKFWPWVIALPVGAKVVIGLIILGVIIYATIASVKKARKEEALIRREERGS